MAINIPSYNMEKLEKLMEFFIDLKQIGKYTSPNLTVFCEDSIKTLSSVRNALESYKKIVDSYQTESTLKKPAENFAKSAEDKDQIIKFITSLMNKTF